MRLIASRVGTGLRVVAPLPAARVPVDCNHDAGGRGDVDTPIRKDGARLNARHLAGRCRTAAAAEVSRVVGPRGGQPRDVLTGDRNNHWSRPAVHLMLSIRTARLELVAAPPDVTSREASGVEDWYAPLDVEKPEAWPPPFNDEASQTWFARR